MGKYSVIIPDVEIPEEFSGKCKKAVENGNITYVGKTCPLNEDIIEYKSGYIIPGFIDIH